MSDSFAPRVGGTLSADIAVPEHEREVRFYSRVLCTGEQPLWKDDLMNNLSLPIIGLGQQSPEYADLPLQWMPHIQVADVAASAERALALGGSEIMHGKDEEGNSQWAAMFDPSGAAFGLIPVVPEEIYAQVYGAATPEAKASMGCIAWLDLTVPDATAARDFYKEVIGWSAEGVGMKEGDEQYSDYVMSGGDGEPAGGICHARGVNLGLPSSWMIYLPVGDLAESVRIVEEEGGKVIKASKNKDGAYTIAVIEDPAGVSFALAQA